MLMRATQLVQNACGCGVGVGVVWCRCGVGVIKQCFNAMTCENKGMGRRKRKW